MKYYQRKIILLQIAQNIGKIQYLAYGSELVSNNTKVIDIALKYGYESPDSFAKAFRKFHGVLPSQARNNGCNLRFFSRLCLKISLEGGNAMKYRIEEKPKMILTGYKTHFTGIPYGEEREQQEEKLFVSTRGKQRFLRGVANNADAYCVITNITGEGYDFYYCHWLLFCQQMEELEMMLERDWKKKNARECDLTFRSLLISALAGKL